MRIDCCTEIQSLNKNLYDITLKKWPFKTTNDIFLLPVHLSGTSFEQIIVSEIGLKVYL